MSASSTASGGAIAGLDNKTSVVSVNKGSSGTSSGPYKASINNNNNNSSSNNGSSTNNNNNNAITTTLTSIASMSSAPTKFDIEEMINYVLQCKPLSE